MTDDDLPLGADGAALSTASVAIVRACRAHKFDDAITMLAALPADQLADLIGVNETAAGDAYRAGKPQLARRFADYAETGARIYASWATSGGEGQARMHDVAELVARLARLRG
jgi:hypothetical protein